MHLKTAPIQGILALSRKEARGLKTEISYRLTGIDVYV